MLEQNQIDTLITQLKEKNVQFVNGLTDYQLGSIEKKIGGTIPADYRLFLSTSLPIQSNKEIKFPRWDQDTDQVIEDSQNLVLELIEFDIESNGFWHDIFGERPDNIGDSVAKALSIVCQWPKLIPVIGHRYMIPGTSDSRVISFHGPLDTIVYGININDYLINEFGIDGVVESRELEVDGSDWGRLLLGNE